MLNRRLIIDIDATLVTAYSEKSRGTDAQGGIRVRPLLAFVNHGVRLW
jgi:hypothetical protein